MVERFAWLSKGCSSQDWRIFLRKAVEKREALGCGVVVKKSKPDVPAFVVPTLRKSAKGGAASFSAAASNSESKTGQPP